MGVVKLLGEPGYSHGCYVLRARNLLTSNPESLVGPGGEELSTYWSAAHKFHELNKVLWIPHLF